MEHSGFTSVQQPHRHADVGLLVLAVVLVAAALFVYEWSQQQLLVLCGQALVMLGSWVLLSKRARQQAGEHGALQRQVEALAQAHSREQASNRFLANMSHELRTSVGGVMGMLGLLDTNKLSPTQADYVFTARHSAQHLLRLLNDVLDMSSLDAGKMSLRPVVVNLPALLDDVRAFVEPMARAKGLGLSVTIDPRSPPWVLVDDTRLKQILLNLLSNAVKFSKVGTVRLGVVLCDEGPAVPGEVVRVRMDVVDQGRGMDSSTIARLFNRFEQGDTDQYRENEGTGLGLEISRNLARLMQGDITVSSTPGQGSVFSLTVLLHCVDIPEPVATPVVMVSVADEESRSPLDIVVADDNATNRKLMHDLLLSCGHLVRFAENGQQAVDEVCRQVPDVVLMDMHMPIMDGISATKVLRTQQGPAATVPIIALTADVMDGLRTEAFAAGVDDYMTKPLDIEVFQAKLGALFPHGGAINPVNPPIVAAPVVLAAKSAPRVAPPKLSPGDVRLYLNMNVLGGVCLVTGVQGYQEIVRDFALLSSGSFCALCDALSTDTADLRELAHAAKGEAASLGLSRLSDLAHEIEEAPPELSVSKRAEVRDNLIRTWQTTEALLSKLGFAQPDIATQTSAC